MRDNSKLYTFRLVNGFWRQVDNPECVLADFLATFGLNFDERVQFARVYDYNMNVCIWYRAYNGAKITVQIFPLTPIN